MKVKQQISTLFNHKTQRFAFNSVVFSSTLFAVFMTCLIGYCLFYAWVMPGREEKRDLYLDYSNSEGIPVGQLFNQHDSLRPLFLAHQRYNVALYLSVPETPTNLAMGNFMISINLLNKDGKIILTSKRPASITFKSDLLRGIETIWNIGSLVGGWKRQESPIIVSLIEGFEVGKGVDSVHSVTVRINSTSLQVYSCALLLQTNYQGLPYFMHHWFFLTASFFITGGMGILGLVGIMGWGILFNNDEKMESVDIAAKMESENELESSEDHESTIIESSSMASIGDPPQKTAPRPGNYSYMPLEKGPDGAMANRDLSISSIYSKDKDEMESDDEISRSELLDLEATTMEFEIGGLLNGAKD